MREQPLTAAALGRVKVAIIGAGRMGSLLAERIPAACRKVIISPEKGAAQSLADEVGGLASDQMSAVRGCRAVFLAVPGSAVVAVVQEILPHLTEDYLIINMATDVLTDDLMEAFPKGRFAGAKVIGHAREMSLGSPGVLVLDHVSGENEALLRALLDGLGHVIKGREQQVMEASRAVVEVMVRADEELRTRLEALGLDPSLAQAAITTAGPGVLRSLTEGDAGSFVQSVIERLREGEGAPAAH